MCTPLDDNEIVYRRIPPGETWLQPPDRITSANFKLEPGEQGLSVYRASVVTPKEVLHRPGVPPGFRIAEARVGDIRQLTKPEGDRQVPLNLDVVAVADADDPGHAEIRGNITRSASRQLAKLFRLVEV